VELRRFFERVIRASFHDLALDGDPVAPYLVDLLTRFARAEQLHPRALSLPRLESVVDMMLEIEAAWAIEGPEFRPEHEVNVRRHIGDYTLFMMGIFPERVKRQATTSFYIAQGTRAYRFVSEHARASGGGAVPYRRLAERFESYAGALDYARRVHFYDVPSHPFFRLTFE